MADVTLFTLRGSKRAAPRLSERLFRALADKAIDVLLTSQASSDQAISVAVASTMRCRRQRQSLASSGSNADSAASPSSGTRTSRSWPSLAIRRPGSRRHRKCSEHSRAMASRSRPSPREARAGPSPACSTRASDHARSISCIGACSIAQTARTRDCRGRDRRQRSAAAARGRRNTLSARGYDLTVVGLANSRRSAVAPDGIDTRKLARDSRDVRVADGSRSVCRKIKHLDLAACAFVDCTASDAIVERIPISSTPTATSSPPTSALWYFRYATTPACGSLHKTPAPLSVRGNGRRRTSGHLDDPGPRADRRRDPKN